MLNLQYSLPQGREFLFCGISGVPVVVKSWGDRIVVPASVLGYSASGSVFLKGDNGILSVVKDSVNAIDSRQVLSNTLSLLDRHSLALLIAPSVECWASWDIVDQVTKGLESSLSHAYHMDDKVVFTFLQKEVVEVLDDTTRLINNLLTNTVSSASIMPIMGGGSCGFCVNFRLYGDEKYCKQFVAGVLLHAPECTVFTNSSHPSFIRLNTATCPHYVCYGKYGALLKVDFLSDGVEFSCMHPDCTGNIYLSVASIVLSGILGIEKALPLPDEVVEVNPTSVSKLTRLPMNLTDALNLSESSGFLKRLLGESYANLYFSAKIGETKAFDKIVGESEYATYYHKFIKRVDGGATKV